MGEQCPEKEGEITVQGDNKLVEYYLLHSHSNLIGLGDNLVLLKQIIWKDVDTEILTGMWPSQVEKLGFLVEELPDLGMSVSSNELILFPVQQGLRGDEYSSALW